MKADEQQRRVTEKIVLLEKIKANTETQSRFIQRRDITGLRRLLRERADLIHNLVTINDALRNDAGGRTLPPIDEKGIEQTAMQMEREVADYCKHVMEDAVGEYEKIRSELRSIRVRRELKRIYAKWATPMRGNRFDRKG